MNLSYYAIFQYDPDGICISFPDIPLALTCAWNDEDGVGFAKEVLTLSLYGLYPSQLPTPTPKKNIPLKENQKVFSITISMELKEGKLFNPNVVECE